MSPQPAFHPASSGLLGSPFNYQTHGEQFSPLSASLSRLHQNIHHGLKPLSIFLQLLCRQLSFVSPKCKHLQGKVTASLPPFFVLSTKQVIQS